MTRPNDNPHALATIDTFDALDALPARQQALVEQAFEYAQSSRAPNTQRAYEIGVRGYRDWCGEVGLDPENEVTATSMALFATSLASQGRKWSTINVALAGLDYNRVVRGLDPLRKSREVAMVTEGIRRVHGTAFRQAKPITVEQLRLMVEHLDGPAAARDRALLLLGFSGAFRRSELTALNWGDLTREADGYVVTLRQSKTDQEGQGVIKAIPLGGRASTCPVRNLSMWGEVFGNYLHGLGKTQIARDPVFVRYSKNGPLPYRLTDQSVNQVVKRAMTDAGLDPAGYSGHSLRAGFVTAAARANKRIDLIMQQTGHKSVDTVMRYIRHVELFRENAAEGLGL